MRVSVARCCVGKGCITRTFSNGGRRVIGVSCGLTEELRFESLLNEARKGSGARHGDGGSSDHTHPEPHSNTGGRRPLLPVGAPAVLPVISSACA